MSRRGAWVAAIALVAGCNDRPPEVVKPGAPTALVPSHGAVLEDTTPKQDVRLLPAEAYVRSYLQLFGGLAPVDVQARARGADGAQLFDTWDDYLSALGFPDYRNDLPRGTQTNAIMVATFERLGVALCDRALEHDWKAKPAPPVKERVIFAFDEPAAPASAAAFAARFDVLHKTFLGYPAELAPPDRVKNFFELYQGIAKRHAAPGVRSRFTADESGWAAVCYGLVRHPEFQFY